jgi:hypothetical protein
MLQKGHSCKGQIVTGEYVVLVLTVLAVIAGMTIYLKRALQARMNGADIAIVTAARSALGCNEIAIEYEPYYLKTESQAVSSSVQVDTSRSLSNSLKILNTERYVTTQSIQLAPGYAK